MLAQNLDGKCNQPITYALRLLNSIKQNYTITKQETLHKFCHYLPNNQFVFYVDHMALTYLVNKPQFFGRIMQWLLLFFEYDFTVIYKPGRTHSVVDALFSLPLNTKP
jgi:hypothetical protein